MSEPAGAAPPAPPPPNNAFLETIRELNGGALLADLHRAMIDLVGDVRSVTKAGSLTLTINIGLAKGNAETILVSEDIKVKAPKPDRQTTILFADNNNRLSRYHPNQPKLPTMDDGKLRAAEPGELREFPRIAQSGGQETPNE